MSELETHKLDVPGAELQYDVRRNDASTEPALLMVACPMAAAGFGTLAGHFTDRTVVTYDPRGVERSRRADGATWATPEEHADDLHRLIAALGLGPVDIVASSGGAVNTLVLVAKHSEQVRTLVAHEPPAAQVLPDREQALAAIQDIHSTYQQLGLGPGMAKFIVLVTQPGDVPGDFADRPVDPAAFGLPTEDDGSRDDVMLGQHLIACTHYEHDFDALRAASARVVVAAGIESEGLFTGRAAHALAGRLATPVTVFPSHHGGFLGGEYGQTGDPDGFAAKLREVLMS
jgi:pimeloyl-ACP methyl ester carboxylesterase